MEEKNRSWRGEKKAAIAEKKSELELSFSTTQLRALSLCLSLSRIARHLLSCRIELFFPSTPPIRVDTLLHLRVDRERKRARLLTEEASEKDQEIKAEKKNSARRRKNEVKSRWNLCTPLQSWTPRRSRTVRKKGILCRAGF